MTNELCSMWELSSPARTETHVLCIGSLGCYSLDYQGSFPVILNSDAQIAVDATSGSLFKLVSLSF